MELTQDIVPNLIATPDPNVAGHLCEPFKVKW
jgi:hypothetical protein